MSLFTTGTGVETRCLKITEKVSLNNVEHTYILSGQKLIENAIGAIFGKSEAGGQLVLPDR